MPVAASRLSAGQRPRRPVAVHSALARPPGFPRPESQRETRSPAGAVIVARAFAADDASGRLAGSLASSASIRSPRAGRPATAG